MSHQITRITLYPFSIPLKNPFQIATMTSTHAEGVFLRLETNNGLTAWGEATPLHSINGETQATVIATLQKIAPLFLNTSVSNTQQIANIPLYVMPGQTAAISALEMAMFDAAAQATGEPLNSFLGSSDRTEVQSDITIGICPPERAKAATKAILNQNVNTIKIKIGDLPNDAIARVSTVRQSAGPDAKIRMDANQGYNAAQALTLFNHLAEFNIEFCEQPVPRHDTDGLKWLHQRSPISVMADESCFGPEDAAHLAKNEACKLINVKLSKSGGLQRAREIAHICKAHYIDCMMGGMVETRLGVTAAAHLALSDPTFKFFDLDAHHEHAENPIEGGITLQNGVTILPKTPGLGAKPSDKFLKTLTPIEIKPT